MPTDIDTVNPFSKLYRVACPSAGVCVAVGQYRDAAGLPGVIDTLSGGTWTARKAPTPANAGTGAAERATFNGLSSASTTSCVAVGIYGDSNTRFQGLIDTDANGSWTAAQAPQPGDAAPAPNESLHLQTVSCPSPVFCLAVGSYLTSASLGAGVIETYSGGRWTAMVAPLPSNFTPSDSIGAAANVVACSSAVSCAVAGAYPDPGTQQGFLDTWTGLQGYWLVASDGGIFTYGNAGFYGSAGSPPPQCARGGDGEHAEPSGLLVGGLRWRHLQLRRRRLLRLRGGQPLNTPIVGMAATPDGKGYWLVATDGGIFGYGDAGFYGSRGRPAAQQAHRRHGGHSRRPGLLARRLRRRHLRLRRRPLLRLHRQHRSSTSPWSAWRATPDGLGLLARRLRRRHLRLRQRRLLRLGRQPSS